jgi:hypothetical protein
MSNNELVTPGMESDGYVYMVMIVRLDKCTAYHWIAWWSKPFNLDREGKWTSDEKTHVTADWGGCK